jgi:hypothetical protein
MYIHGVNMENIEKIVELGFGICGKMLDGSKSDKNTIYNGNIIVGTKKVWFGDFRLHETYKLDLLAKIVNEDVYLLREMDCRFDTEDKPRLDKAIYSARKDQK